MAEPSKGRKLRSGDWPRAYRTGIEAIASKDYKTALAHFEEAIAADPKAWQPRYGRAWILSTHHESSASNEALIDSDLRATLESAGDSCPDAALLLAQRLANANEHVEALRLMLRGCGRGSHPDCEGALVATLIKCLEAIERNGPSQESIDRCRQLEPYIEAASLPRSIGNALLGEIIASRANLTADGAERLLQLRRLKELIPNHPYLPENFDAQTAHGVRVGSTDRVLPTFSQLAGHARQGSFQSELVTFFETYFDSADLSALRTKLRAFGQAPTRTVLMFGPSGSGKTHVVRSFAGEYQARFQRPMSIHELRLDKVMDKYVGETEKVITKVFDQAIRTQPCIIFADEVDTLGSARDAGQDWKVAQTAHLLQEIDRLCQSEAVVLFFGCTNRLWAIDAAMMRRFDRIVSADLPDADVRRDIFEIRLKNLGADVRPADVNLDALAHLSHGMAPGDIDKAVRRAADRAMSESMRDATRSRLTQEGLQHAIAEYSRPEHVRRWLRDSAEAFRRVGQADRADELERKYQPFVEATGSKVGSASAGGVPDIEWFSEQSYDFSLLRR